MRYVYVLSQGRIGLGIAFNSIRIISLKNQTNTKVYIFFMQPSVVQIVMNLPL